MKTEYLQLIHHRVWHIANKTGSGPLCNQDHDGMSSARVATRDPKPMCLACLASRKRNQKP